MKIFNLPDLGEGLAEAEIREWFVKVGDIVKVDQPLLSVETAKALVDVPSPEDGKIIKLYGKKGEVIKTHSPLVEFEGDNIKDQGSVVGKLEESSDLWKEPVNNRTATKNHSAVKAMPTVRALAKELNIELGAVTPTGSQGQITEADVRQAAEASSLNHPNALKGIRRMMADVMRESHTEIAPVTLMDDADITDLAANSDVTVTVIKAILHAIQREAALHAWYHGKLKQRVLHDAVHLGLAMDTEEGLFVPVIKNAHEKNDQALREAINELKKSVRDRTIAPENLQGATITLSNFGMFAGKYATPIIVPPQVAILGCGRIREEVKPFQGTMAIRKIIPLSLSIDHRVVTGGEASRFLGAIIHYLESNA